MPRGKKKTDEEAQQEPEEVTPGVESVRLVPVLVTDRPATSEELQEIQEELAKLQNDPIGELTQELDNANNDILAWLIEERELTAEENTDPIAELGEESLLVTEEKIAQIQAELLEIPLDPSTVIVCGELPQEKVFLEAAYLNWMFNNSHLSHEEAVKQKDKFYV